MLLHPEGGVGWHSNFVAPLMPGAVEMALEALEEGRKTNPRFPGLGGAGRLEARLHRRRRKAAARGMRLCRAAAEDRRQAAPACRLPSASTGSTTRCWRATQRGLALHVDPQAPFAERQAAVIATLSLATCRRAGRRHRRSTRTNCCGPRAGGCATRAALDADDGQALKSLADGAGAGAAYRPFAFANETVTQEELAEH